jgi:hypothetical protein
VLGMEVFMVSTSAWVASCSGSSPGLLVSAAARRDSTDVFG